MTGFLFQLTFWLTVPFWGLMIFAPKWSGTARITSSPLIAVPPLVVYTVLVAAHLPELWATMSSPDLDTLREFLGTSWGASAIWAQVIAWDLLIGAWMFREGRRLGLHPLLMGPLLVFTIILSPFGFGLFLAIRAFCDARDRATTVVTRQ
ncbi:ABA4-like family protein [Saccharothrix deserti]|uniref:ABA4-like family protein n=1 Tax=Saccharothrix deserti TaxID=2593674 RepID=UPI00131E1214|nr:ABA4-like family protein [Saccharothrix deserti]